MSPMRERLIQNGTIVPRFGQYSRLHQDHAGRLSAARDIAGEIWEGRLDWQSYGPPAEADPLVVAMVKAELQTIRERDVWEPVPEAGA